MGIAGFLGYWFTRNPDPFMEEYSPVENPHSLGGPYAQAAVASDAGPCSEVGKNILAQNGSAVDSAIAAMLCIGVVNMHSTGIGGGGFMLVYNQSGRFAEVFDFRETAPAKATEDMFVNATYKQLNSEYVEINPWKLNVFFIKLTISRKFEIFFASLGFAPLTFPRISRRLFEVISVPLEVILPR